MVALINSGNGCVGKTREPMQKQLSGFMIVPSIKYKKFFRNKLLQIVWVLGSPSEEEIWLLFIMSYEGFQSLHTWIIYTGQRDIGDRR